MTTTDNPGMEYHIKRAVKDFTRLCYHWRQDSRNVPCDFNERWGPPESEMMISAALEFTSQVDFTLYEGPEESSASEAEDDASDDDAYEDEELYAQMEAVALRDEYRGRASHSVLSNAEYSSDDSMQASPSKKRPRHR